MKLLVLLANGCEEVEALTVVDLLRRAQIEVCMVSVEDSKTIVGSHGITFMADAFFKDFDHQEYDGVYLPGGLPGAKVLEENKEVIQMVRQMFQQNRLISAICAAPVVLEKAGILKNRSVTCYPGFEKRILEGKVEKKAVVVDRNIITGRSVGAAMELGIALISYLLGENRGQEIGSQCLAYEREMDETGR